LVFIFFINPITIIRILTLKKYCILCLQPIHLALWLVVFSLVPELAFSQVEKKVVPDGTDGLQLTVPVVDSATGKATNLPPNQVNTPVSTIKLGMGYIGDYATFSESSTFKQQMDSAGLTLKSMYKTRDFRILASGKFNTRWDLSWKTAYMYDGNNEVWMLRETGITIGTPELFGYFLWAVPKKGIPW
jgi:phosphate-selective porin OprO/OprP